MGRKVKYGRPRKGSKRGGLTVVRMKKMLHVHGWKITRIAKTYGITRQAVYQFCWRHEITLPERNEHDTQILDSVPSPAQLS